MKFQSAMEYMTTYGWAILIIGIVMVAMFSLGVFNGNTYTAKAQPGCCTVLKNTYGGSTLSGSCLGCIPQYSTIIITAGSITAPVTSAIEPNYVTISLWAYQSSASTTGSPLSGVTGGGNGYALLLPATTGMYSFQIGGVSATAPDTSGIGKWVNVVGTYSSSNTVTLYVNGAFASSASAPLGLAYVGATPHIFNNQGSGTLYISNVQVYNTSLSAGGVQALYQEGIGGVPIDLQNLVAWWPLNGNTNDFSGNGNNAASATGISYTTNWYNNYVQP